MKLVEALIGRDWPPVELVGHSRSSAPSGSMTIGGAKVRTRSRRLPESLVTPDRAVPSTSRVASMTPLLPVEGALSRGVPVWWDLYDDWSIAPEIGFPIRLAAYRNYRLARQAKCLVTVNSAYMRAKIGQHAHWVPNGTDPELGEWPLLGDDRPRLLMLGSFRGRRTDYVLAEQVAERFSHGEVIVAGPGTESLSLPGHANVSSAPYLTWEGVAQLAGARTIALIPHIVTDYTLSQDPIKMYYYLALGIPVLMPRLLFGGHVDPAYVGLLDYGSDFDKIINILQHADHRPGPDWRQAFALEHSWTARAATILDRLLR